MVGSRCARHNAGESDCEPCWRNAATKITVREITEGRGFADTHPPSRRPTHHHPQASPRPADPKCPLPQSCTTTACACRVSRQSWRASTDAPPTPHQTHFPPTFTRFPTHTTKCATPHSCTMMAPTYPHSIDHAPSRLQHQRHAYTTRATLPTSAPPKTPPFPTTWPHATGHTTPIPWSGPPQPPCFSEPDTPCVRWNRRGGHSTHLHHTRPVPGRRGPFSSSTSADPPSAAERAMRDQQAVSRPASPSQHC